MPSLPFTLTQGQELVPREAYTFLLYGDGGTGKTDFAGSFGDRTLYLNIGGGINTLYSPGFESRYGKWNGIRVMELENMKAETGSDKKFDFICDIIDQTDPALYDTIVIDDATALRKLAMNKALQMNSETGKSQSLGPSKKYDVAMTAVQDYQAEMNLMEWFVSTYTQMAKASGKNFVMLAHVRREYGKPAMLGQQPPVSDIKPGFTGKDNRISAAFDNVWYMSFEGGKHIAYTKGTDLVEAKTRLGGIFPDRFFNPNYPIINQTLTNFYEKGIVPAKDSFKR